MGKIFISYRHDDSEYIVGRIYEDLCTAYGKKNIFKDVDSIPLGVDFRNEISEVVHSCDILIALIGEKWNTIADDSGNPRINNPDDFVRIEIEEALQRNIPVIPILTSKAELPKESGLPDSLKELAYRNAIRIRPDPDYKTDIIRLKNNIDKTYKKQVNFIPYFTILAVIVVFGGLYYIFFERDEKTGGHTVEPQIEHENDRRITPSIITKGNQSPAINASGDVVIDYSTTTINQANKSPHSKPLPLLDHSLPRNSVENDNSISEIISYFDDLQKLDGEIVYIRFSTYVGAGIGIDDVPKDNKIRAGVIFNLSNYLDGFGGNHDDYQYGYSIEVDEYRDNWNNSRQSTILFPKKGNAFFDVHYMKSMNFEGVAKIKISAMQGFQWIEIIPADLEGDLKDQYDEIRSKIKRHPSDNFEF